MNNTWYDDTLINRFGPNEHLTNNHKCAVLIVGGGLAGLSLLYKLKKNNVDAVLIEENHIGSGASGRNGGFCLSGWAQDYDVLLKYLSKEEVVTLEKIAASGVKWMKKKCLSEGYEHTNLQSGVLKCFLTNNVEKVKNDLLIFINTSLILVVSFATDRNITAKTPRKMPMFIIGKNIMFKKNVSIRAANKTSVLEKAIPAAKFL